MNYEKKSKITGLMLVILIFYLLFYINNTKTVESPEIVQTKQKLKKTPDKKVKNPI